MSNSNEKKSLSLFCLFIFYLFFASEGSIERGGSISVDDAKMLPIYLYSTIINASIFTEILDLAMSIQDS